MKKANEVPKRQYIWIIFQIDIISNTSVKLSKQKLMEKPKIVEN